MPSNSHPTIVLTIDGINSFMLGMHGNTSLETPAFDAFAARGISFDFAFAPSCDLPAVLRAMFSGSGDQPVTATLQGSSTFVSDCTVAVAAAESAAFDSIIAVEQKQTAAPAENLAETQAADFFAAATEAIGTLNEGDLLWLHFSGLSSAWDSPIELREQYRAMALKKTIQIYWSRYNRLASHRSLLLTE